MDTDELRRELIEKRKTLPSEEVKRRSEVLVEKFLSKKQMNLDWRYFSIGCYYTYGGEVELSNLVERVSVLDAKIYFPRVSSYDEKRMEMHLVSPETNWEKNRFGIMEPSKECSVVDPKNLDLIFVPGVAFGTQGQRLGFGLGFYDRYLARATNSLRVSLAYDFQIKGDFDQRSWDKKIDWIVGENYEYCGERVEPWLESH